MRFEFRNWNKNLDSTDNFKLFLCFRNGNRFQKFLKMLKTSTSFKITNEVLNSNTTVGINSYKTTDEHNIYKVLIKSITYKKSRYPN